MIEINKIYNESCLDTINKIPDNFIDCVITSPPYNMRTRVMNNKYVTREKTDHFSKKYQYFDDAMPVEEFYQFHKEVLSLLLLKSKIVFYNIQIVTGSKEAFFRMMGDFYDRIKDVVIWDKGHGQPAMHSHVLNSCYEMVWVLENDDKKGRLINNSKFKRGELDNIWRIKRGKKKCEHHGAVFPEELVEKVLENFTVEGDLVYDPFLGTGTTAVVAKRMNRKYIGSELVKEIFDVAEEALNVKTIKEI